jgi:hypothetical protein
MERPFISPARGELSVLQGFPHPRAGPLGAPSMPVRAHDRTFAGFRSWSGAALLARRRKDSRASYGRALPPRLQRFHAGGCGQANQCSVPAFVRCARVSRNLQASPRSRCRNSRQGRPDRCRARPQESGRCRADIPAPATQPHIRDVPGRRQTGYPVAWRRYRRRLPANASAAGNPGSTDPAHAAR